MNRSSLLGNPTNPTNLTKQERESKENKNEILPYNLLDKKTVRFSNKNLPPGPIYSINNATKRYIKAIKNGKENGIKKALPSYINTRLKGVFKPVQINEEPTSQQQQQTSQQRQQSSQQRQQQPTLRQRQSNLPQIGWVDIVLILVMIAAIIGPILLILFSSSNISDSDDDNEEDFNNYYYNTDTICQCDKCKNFNVTNNIMPYNI